MRGNVAGAIAFAATLFLGISLRAEEYNVSLTRPSKIGDSYTVSVSSLIKEKRTETVNSKAPEEDAREYRIELTGRSTVLTVDENGDDIELSCTIDTCQKIFLNEGKPVAELIKTGSTMHAKRNAAGETEFTVDKQPVSNEVREALLNILEFSPKGAPTLNEIFGTSKKQKVGNTWPVNLKAAVENFKCHGLKVHPKAIQGSTTLAKVVEEQGIQCLQIEIKFIVDPIESTKVKLAPNQKIIQSNVRGNYTMIRAIDSANMNGRTRYETGYAQTIETTGDDGQKTLVHVERTAMADVLISDYKPAIPK